MQLLRLAFRFLANHVPSCTSTSGGRHRCAGAFCFDQLTCSGLTYPLPSGPVQDRLPLPATCVCVCVFEFEKSEQPEERHNICVSVFGGSAARVPASTDRKSRGAGVPVRFDPAAVLWRLTAEPSCGPDTVTRGECCRAGGRQPGLSGSVGGVWYQFRNVELGGGFIVVATSSRAPTTSCLPPR